MEREESGLEERKHVKRDPELIVSFAQGLLDTGQGSQNPGPKGDPGIKAPSWLHSSLCPSLKNWAVTVPWQEQG